MLKKLYWTQRYERIGTVDLTNLSLNGVYTASFYLNWQFADWTISGLTKVTDLQIPEERYTSEIVSWVKKLTRWIECEYNEAYVDAVELQRSLENVWARFNVDVFSTLEEARQWVRDNTDLVEETPWVFEISPAWVDMMWNPTEAQTLIIE